MRLCLRLLIDELFLNGNHGNGAPPHLEISESVKGSQTTRPGHDHTKPIALGHLSLIRHTKSLLMEQEVADTLRPLPVPTPETQHFWDGTKNGELRLQTCSDCHHTYFPPRPFCPQCGSRNVAVTVASGRGTLDSYVISHRPHKAFDGPYAIALVALEEGPRMMSNIVGCDQTPEALQLDMPLVVTFEEAGENIYLPLFTPVGVST